MTDKNNEFVFISAPHPNHKRCGIRLETTEVIIGNKFASESSLSIKLQVAESRFVISCNPHYDEMNFINWYLGILNSENIFDVCFKFVVDLGKK